MGQYTRLNKRFMDATSLRRKVGYPTLFFYLVQTGAMIALLASQTFLLIRYWDHADDIMMKLILSIVVSCSAGYVVLTRCLSLVRSMDAHTILVKGTQAERDILDDAMELMDIKRETFDPIRSGTLFATLTLAGAVFVCIIVVYAAVSS